MITVIASIRVKSGHMEEFLAAFQTNLPTVRKEAGCLEYYPAVDVDAALPAQTLDPHVVTVLEKWESLDALRAHLVAPHMAIYRQKVKAIVEGASLKVLTAV